MILHDIHYLYIYFYWIVKYMLSLYFFDRRIFGVSVEKILGRVLPRIPQNFVYHCTVLVPKYGRQKSKVVSRFLPIFHHPPRPKINMGSKQNQPRILDFDCKVYANDPKFSLIYSSQSQNEPRSQLFGWLPEPHTIRVNGYK